METGKTCIYDVVDRMNNEIIDLSDKISNLSQAINQFRRDKARLACKPELLTRQLTAMGQYLAALTERYSALADYYMEESNGQTD